MIVCSIEDSSTYEGLHPQFKSLFDYIKSHDLLVMELGRIVLDGEKLYINNSLSDMKDANEQIVEVHRRYIDVHIPLDKCERIGWMPLAELQHPDTVYKEQEDFAFFSDRPRCYVDVEPGHCLIAFPEDGHAPIIGEGKIRKAIAKILL